MNNNRSSVRTRFFNLINSLVGIVLLVVLAVGVITMLSTRRDMTYQANTLAQPTPTGTVPSGAERDHTVYLPIVVKEQDTPDSDVNDPTADWLMYTNDKLGYSIKYPPNFRYVEWDVGHDDPNELQYISFYDNNYRGKYAAPEIGIVVYKNPNSLSVQEWLSNEKEGLSKGMIDVQVVKEAQLNIRQAQKRVDVPSIIYIEDLRAYEEQLYVIILEHGDKFFKPFYGNGRDPDVNLEPIFNLMLETLEFSQ